MDGMDEGDGKGAGRGERQMVTERRQEELSMQRSREVISRDSTVVAPIRRLLQVELVSPRACAAAAGDSQPSTLNSQLPSGPCLDFVASTGCVDRYQEVIEPSGWHLENYLRNPVFQNAHQYGDVLYTLGRALITEVRDVGDGRKGLFQRIEFATEANPVARVAYGLYAGGFLSAVSVGFVPLRWEEGSEKTPFRRRYIEQELLEVSAVAVPANPEALALACKEGAFSEQDLKESAEILARAAGRIGRVRQEAASCDLMRLARELARVMRS